MDAITTKTEVMDALTKELGRKDCLVVKLGNIRPAKDNTQTITIIADENTAKELLQKGAITIGVVKCPVEERVNVVQCRKC